MKAEINFTELEKQFLRNYFSKGINLDFLSDQAMTLHCICATIAVKEGKFIQLDTLKGVLGSLTKKGILECDDYDGDEEHNLIYPSQKFNWTQESFQKIMSFVK